MNNYDETITERSENLNKLYRKAKLKEFAIRAIVATICTVDVVVAFI